MKRLQKISYSYPYSYSYSYSPAPHQMASAIFRLVVPILLLLVAEPLLAQETTIPFDTTFSAWNRVVARCATPAGFRYSEIVIDASDLEVALSQFEQVSRDEFEAFPRDLQLAFLVNAHNAYAVHRVARRYPVKSIEKTRLLGSALNAKSIRLLGRRWSLRSLREEIMGPRFRDARALFLLNWGMRSCPPLPSVAVTPANLRELLDLQTQRFVRDPRYYEHAPTETRFRASPLLKEYRDDIERDFTTLWSFIQHYATAEVADSLDLRPTKIVWLDFDKRLNDDLSAPAIQLAQ